MVAMNIIIDGQNLIIIIVTKVMIIPTLAWAQGACLGESYDSVDSLEAFPPDVGGHVDEGAVVASFPLHLDTCPLRAFPPELAAAVVAAAAAACGPDEPG